METFPCKAGIRIADLRNSYGPFHLLSSFQYYQSGKCNTAHHCWINIYYPFYMVSNKTLDNISGNANESFQTYGIYFISIISNLDSHRYSFNLWSYFKNQDQSSTWPDSYHWYFCLNSLYTPSYCPDHYKEL